MEHIAAILLIVGCSNSLDKCRELPAPVTVFETYEECSAERPFAVGDLSQKTPRVFSRCLAVDPALEEDYNEIVWDVRKDGTFDASIGISNVVVAANNRHGNESLLRRE